MDKVNVAEVLINGKVYKISGTETPFYMNKVASYLNEMEERISHTKSYHSLSSDQKQLMKNMNLADEYFKEKEKRERLEKEAEQKDKEIYSLKHDVIDGNMEIERLRAKLVELEEQKKELEDLLDEKDFLLKSEKKRQDILEKSIAKRKIIKPEKNL